VRRFRVGVDARSLLCREPRGEGKSLLRLYEEMAGLDPALDPVLFGDESTRDYRGPLPARARVVTLGSRGQRWNLWENLRLPWAAHRRRCDVLHCTSSGGPRWAGMPTVVTVHDLIPMLVDDGQTAAAREAFRRRLSHGLRGARAVIAVSEHTRSDLASAFPAAAARVHVVPWGAPAAAAATAGEGRPYALAFGGSAPRKNTLYTVERFAAVAARAPAVDLVLTGISAPAMRERVTARAAELGVAGRVRMPGFVTEAELGALLGGATLVLYLSRYEGFGLPLLEAVAHGVPVLASNASSIPEVIGAEGTYALDQPQALEAALLRLATSADERARLHAAQAATTRRFDWRDTAARTLALLRQAAENTAPSMGGGAR
jgi:glycosyltransferase involved in cell wall biosynthesis